MARGDLHSCLAFVSTTDKAASGVTHIRIEGFSPIGRTVPGSELIEVRIQVTFVVIHVKGVCFADLTEIVEALDVLPPRFGLLQSGQQHGSQDCYDSDNDKKFDQGKSELCFSGNR